MTNRVHIDAPAGMVEIEGEKDFVEGLLAKLFPLLEEAGFGSKPQGREPDRNGDDTANQSEAFDSSDAGKQKTKRRRVNAPPKGHSCPDRIMVLRNEGFFKSQRSVPEIIDGLAAKGWTHAANQVGAALSKMFGRSDIQRTKDGKGPWRYFWDRIDA